MHNVTVHIGGQPRPLLKYHTLAKYLGIFIDQHLTWQKHTEYVLQRIRGSYIVYIVYSLCLILFYFDCIEILFFPLLTFVTLYGFLQQLYYLQNLWSTYMPDLLATCLMMLVLLRLPCQNPLSYNLYY